MESTAALFALVSLTLLAGVVFELVRVLRGDGYGRRAPSAPPSWSAGDLPSRPYRDAGR